MVETGGILPGSACHGSREGDLDSSRSLRAWFVPDVAFVASSIALFYCLFLFSGYKELFRDSDAGWHIRTGEHILATGALPRTDPYSFTRAGEAWYAWEWGADVVAGIAHRSWGLAGVAMLYAVAIAFGVWLWFQLHWIVGGNFPIACALAIPLLSTCNLHWLARPHIFGWLFLLAAVIWAENAPVEHEVGRRKRLPHGLWTVALFSALWTNIHASFFLAPVIAVIYAASHFLRPLIWDLDRASEWRRARWFGTAALVAALASLVNPYGWGLHRHVVAYATDGELLRRVGEFQSFDFHAPGAGQILLALGVAMFGGVLALGQKNLAHFLLALLLIGSALRSARGLPLVALVLLPLANGTLTRALENCGGLRPAVRRFVDGFLAYSTRLRGFDVHMNGLALAPVVILLSFVLLRTPAIAARTGFPPDQFPVAAAAQLEKLPSGMRLLAPDKFGGYLIYRFDGKLKVFFDGRSDLYGADFLKRYARLVQVRPGWLELLDAYGFTHALLPNDYSLVAALEQLGWRVMYRDGTATLLEKPNEIARSWQAKSGSGGTRADQGVCPTGQQSCNHTPGKVGTNADSAGLEARATSCCRGVIQRVGLKI